MVQASCTCFSALPAASARQRADHARETLRRTGAFDGGPPELKEARLNSRAAFSPWGVGALCYEGWNAPTESRAMSALLQAVVGCGMNSESVSSGG